MKISFGNNKIARQLENASEIKKAFGLMAKKVAQRLDDIQAAPNLFVLKQLPQVGCHELKGDRGGEWAVNISVNHRLIFTIDHNPIPRKHDKAIDEVLITDIIIVGAEDYH